MRSAEIWATDREQSLIRLVRKYLVFHVLKREADKMFERPAMSQPM